MRATSLAKSLAREPSGKLGLPKTKPKGLSWQWRLWTWGTMMKNPGCAPGKLAVHETKQHEMRLFCGSGFAVLNVNMWFSCIGPSQTTRCTTWCAKGASAQCWTWQWMAWQKPICQTSSSRWLWASCTPTMQALCTVTSSQTTSFGEVQITVFWNCVILA